jgi:hypothetical protein
MRNPLSHAFIPDPDERTALTTALVDANTETGFWDDHGRPAPWPEDIEDWTPTTSAHDAANHAF